jgi:hypothetical protein
MHYKNGREAKNGDKVMLIPSYSSPIIGILYDAVAGNDFCNGKIAPISPLDPCPNLKECLHLDDALPGDDLEVEVLAKQLHEAGREAVERNLIVRTDVPSKGFMEWDNITEDAREGRRVQARFLLARYKVFPK